MRRLLTMVLGLALLAAACGDPFDCSVVQCDGLYEAEGEAGASEYLRFWADGTVIWVVVAPTEMEPTVDVEAVGTWLNRDYEDFSSGDYDLDDGSVSFAVGDWRPSEFEGRVDGDTLTLQRRDLETGESEERIFEFRDVEVVE